MSDCERQRKRRVAAALAATLAAVVERCRWSGSMTVLPGEASERPTRVRWMVAGLLAAAAAIAYLDRVVISNVVLEIQEALELSSAQSGWMLAAFVIGYGLMQVPTGRLGDRVSIRVALPLIVILWSLMTGLTPLATSFAALFAIRCGFGMAQAGVFPFSVPALRRWFPVDARARATATVVSATRFGAVLAALAAPLIARFGWQTAFVLCGSVGGLWAASFAWRFRDTPRQHPSVNREERELIGDADGSPVGPRRARHGGPSVAGSRLPLWRLVADKNVVGMSFGQFFSAMGYYLYITWFPTYLRKQYGFDLASAGLLAVVPHVGGWIGAGLGGVVTDRLLRATGSLRWSRRGVWLAGKTVCGLLFVAAAFQGNAFVAVMLVGVAALFSDAGSPASWAAVTDIGGRHSGVVFGIQNAAGSIGAAICPVLVPIVVAAWGWQTVLPVFACIFLAAAASWILVDAARPLEGGE